MVVAEAPCGLKPSAANVRSLAAVPLGAGPGVVCGRWARTLSDAATVCLSAWTEDCVLGVLEGIIGSGQGFPWV